MLFPMRNRKVGAGVLVAVIVLAVVAWDAVRYQVIPKRLAPVEEGFFYRSGQISPRLIGSVLDDLGIDTVVSLVAYNEARPEHVAERAAAEARGVRWMSFDMRGNGTTANPEDYVTAVAEIHRAREAGEQVLVHCASGVRRAAGVTSVYRVLVEGDSPDRVFEEELDRYVGPFGLWGPRSAVKSRIFPFLNDNMAFFAERLVEVGVIPAAPDPIPQFISPT
jgi:protein tyrosine phosphatase (PTP) superfamily phosphohydrolase (DUF442 family)